MDRFKYYLSWITWPVLFFGCCILTGYGFAGPYPMLSFNAVYLSLIAVLVALEGFMPHDEYWQERDGQTWVNIAHTLSSKATVQALLIFGGVIGLTELITPLDQPGYSIWPRDWPLVTQIIIGVYAAEFGLYWAHRLAHEWPLLWRFHAIHHSVTRLWVINTGRFHFIDSLVSILLAIVILLALGAPLEIVKWQAAITAFIGVLTHCNVEMRFGPLSWIFVTPELHRWHHSMKLAEGNKNYGENIILWDQVFGSYINEKRRPPQSIGIPEYMPPKFWHQFLWPFLTLAQKTKIKDQYPDHGAEAKARLSAKERKALEEEHNVKLSSIAVPKSFGKA